MTSPATESAPKCFKCLSPGAHPFHRSAPYLAAKLYLCLDCIKPRPKHKPNAEFACGCTEVREAWQMTKHWRPPREDCAACSGTGKIRDRHRHLGKKRSVGHSDERERLGHYRRDELDPEPVREYFPDGSWVDRPPDYWRTPTFKRGGRPKSTTQNMDVMKLYVLDVVNELVDRNVWMLELNEDDFKLALGVLTMMVFALTPKANARDMATWLGIGKSSVYNYRKVGQMFLDMIADVQSLKHRADMDELRWAELFRRLESLAPESREGEDEQEAWTKP